MCSKDSKVKLGQGLMFRDAEISLIWAHSFTVCRGLKQHNLHLPCNNDYCIFFIIYTQYVYIVTCRNVMKCQHLSNDIIWLFDGKCTGLDLALHFFLHNLRIFWYSILQY